MSILSDRPGRRNISVFGRILYEITEPEEDFRAMFKASTRPTRFEKGQTVEGTVVAIGPEGASVDVGGKGEATIEIDELKDADGDLDVAAGDRIQAVVVSTAGGLTTRQGVGS